MDGWLWSALAALMLYGLWGIFPKIAVSYISPQSALLYQIGGAMLVGIVALAQPGFRLESHPRGILFAVLTGIAGMTGTLFYLHAARHGKISVVVTLTALYPLLTILLATLVLKEPLTVKQLCGMGLALVAIVLVAG